MPLEAKRTVLHIELWHAAFLLALLAGLGPVKLVEPGALLLGGFFMGLNFLLLSVGVAWVLTPLAGSGRLKLGVALLGLKIFLFLGLLTLLFFRFEIDAISFALGFSALLLAILVEGLRKGVLLEL
jgi:hypothetical protein